MNYVGGECFAGGLCLSVVGFARLIYEVSKYSASQGCKLAERLQANNASQR